MVMSQMWPLLRARSRSARHEHLHFHAGADRRLPGGGGRVVDDVERLCARAHGRSATPDRRQQRDRLFSTPQYGSVGSKCLSIGSSSASSPDRSGGMALLASTPMTTLRRLIELSRPPELRTYWRTLMSCGACGQQATEAL